MYINHLDTTFIIPLCFYSKPATVLYCRSERG